MFHLLLKDLLISFEYHLIDSLNHLHVFVLHQVVLLIKLFLMMILNLFLFLHIKLVEYFLFDFDNYYFLLVNDHIDY